MGTLASAQVAAGNLDRALKTCDTAIANDPRCFDAYALKSTVLQRLGRFEDAIQTSFKLHVLNPDDFRPYLDIIQSKRIDAGDGALVRALETICSSAPLEESIRGTLYRSLGKAFDDLGQYDAANNHFETANRIARNCAILSYDAARRDQDRRSLKQQLDVSRFKLPSAPASNGPIPIFIVGMIRSGTTLLDSMLSRLENVDSAGEMRFWNREAGRILADRHLFETEFESGQTAQRYLEELTSSVPNCDFVIDKMPLNFQYLGLLHAALPQAKIIHLRRHPVDTAISIYTSDYGPNPPTFAYEKQRILHFYRHYLDLMDFWRRVLPGGCFLEIDYEEVVTAPEVTLRKVLSYLEIPWTEVVLDRSTREVDVNTPSRWQARQEVYSSSIGRWKHYYPWLGEFADLLTVAEKASMNSQQ